MPGLIRGVARTAVIAGTASAVNGRVQRRQAERFAERDANIAAERERAYAQQSAPETSEDDKLAKLKQLGELRAQGILTEEEFGAEKAKLLGR